MHTKAQDIRAEAYMRSGRTLTPFSAFTRFGILAMHSCAARIRRKRPVNCRMVTRNGKRFGEYSMGRK